MLHLLNKGADTNITDCNDSGTPILLACQNGHELTALHLLNKGASSDLAKNDSGMSLFVA